MRNYECISGSRHSARLYDLSATQGPRNDTLLIRRRDNTGRGVALNKHMQTTCKRASFTRSDSA